MTDTIKSRRWFIDDCWLDFEEPVTKKEAEEIVKFFKWYRNDRHD